MNTANVTRPQIGDTLTYTLAPGGTATPNPMLDTRRKNYCMAGRTIHEAIPDSLYSCAECKAPWERFTSRIRAIIDHLDGSVQVTLVDGTRHEVIVPHGDRCY